MGLFKSKHRAMPFMGETHQRTLHKNLEFTATEQYKLLRTNLNFTVPHGTKCPVVGVTSSMRGEGKSTTALNLSYVLAELGSKVLLIDGDLRIPSIAKKMSIPSHTKPIVETKDIILSSESTTKLEARVAGTIVRIRGSKEYVDAI